MDLSIALVQSLLNEAFCNSEYSQPSTVYLAAHTADPLASAASGASPAYYEVGSPGSSGYSRSSIAFTAASGTSRSVSNTSSVQITMPSTLGNNTAVPFLGLWSASTGGTLMARIPILGTTWEATVDGSGIVTTGVAHGLAADDRIVFEDLGPATTPALPTFAVNTIYYVRSGFTSTTFTVATSSGGAAVTGTAGGLIARKLNVQTFNASNVLQVDAGALTIRL